MTAGIMVFSSFLFVFGFLPIFLVCYFLSPRKGKNLVVLLASYIFYAWGAPKIVPALLVSSLFDFFISKKLAKAQNKKRGLLLFVGISTNLGLLLYYKYANFFVAEVNRAFSMLDIEAIHWTTIVLPIGISFFTFQKISYLVDVYRDTVSPARSAINYLLYVASFPQLIAGPIVRYHDVSKQIEERTHNVHIFFEGVCRFCIGLGKKVLIADPMGAVTRNVFRLDAAELSTGYAWLGIMCYAYQIYFDFSGYSDMAIGLGRMMGFRFLENFDRPYTSQNFTEFWRRWHISLSRWMRDYLYIPLGGNRGSKSRVYLNLWIVFLLSGLWHGASWSFLVWGAFHGFFLMLDKLFWLRVSKRLGRFVNTLLTFVLVCVGWVFFRIETIPEAMSYLAHMFNVVEYSSVSVHALRGMIIHDQGVFIFFLATLLCFAPSLPKFSDLAKFFSERFSETHLACARFSLSAACLVLSALALATTDFAPFIYFRF